MLRLAQAANIISVSMDWRWKLLLLNLLMVQPLLVVMMRHSYEIRKETSIS